MIKKNDEERKKEGPLTIAKVMEPSVKSLKGGGEQSSTREGCIHKMANRHKGRIWSCFMVGSSRNRDRRHNPSIYVLYLRSHRFGNFMGTSGGRTGKFGHVCWEEREICKIHKHASQIILRRNTSSVLHLPPLHFTLTDEHKVSHMPNMSEFIRLFQSGHI